MFIKLAGVIFLCLLIESCWTVSEPSNYFYTNDFAVEINGDFSTAEAVASAHGFRLLRHVRNLGSVYQFAHENSPRRSRRSAIDLSKKLSSDPNVVWVEQQKVLQRTKRSSVSGKLNAKEVQSESFSSTTGFNDPFFKDQWYLVNRGQLGGVKGHDLNVAPVWKKGFTGKGVVVSILDDGLDYNHPDLKENYDPLASANLNDLHDPNNDPMPNSKDPYNSHGTRCAGEIAAKANNSNCCVGVAYNVKIGGVRLLDGVVTDILEAQALLYNNQHVDIYSSSWGPSDDGQTMDGPRRYGRQALRQAVVKGRAGKGSIFVWASGNGGAQDDCNCDGYVSSIYTLAVGSISQDGTSAYFSEICPSTMAVVFTGGSHLPPGDANYQSSQVKVVTTDLNGTCTLSFQGTSSAAPLAAGCVALVLEANSNLTWRDVQHIVVETSVVPNEDEGGWTVNGAGYHVNHQLGFGALDCSRMVEAAQNWSLVQEQSRCIVKGGSKSNILMSGQSLHEVLFTDGCNSSSSLFSSAVDRLEHVQVRVKMIHVKRGDVSIDLISPSGTKSNILKVRPLDDSSEGISFTFMTVHNWGESPVGNWTLVVKDNSNVEGQPVGELVEWSLILYGVQGELANHERWKDSDGRLQKDGRIKGTRLEARRRSLNDESEIRLPKSGSSSPRLSSEVETHKSNHGNHDDVGEELDSLLKSLDQLEEYYKDDGDGKDSKDSTGNPNDNDDHNNGDDDDGHNNSDDDDSDSLMKLVESVEKKLDGELSRKKQLKMMNKKQKNINYLGFYRSIAGIGPQDRYQP